MLVKMLLMAGADLNRRYRGHRGPPMNAWDLCDYNWEREKLSMNWTPELYKITLRPIQKAILRYILTLFIIIPF